MAVGSHRPECCEHAAGLQTGLMDIDSAELRMNGPPRPCLVVLCGLGRAAGRFQGYVRRSSASLAAHLRHGNEDGSVDLNEAAKLAFTYMHLHELHDWHFRFDRATTRFGCCHHRSKTISLSRAPVCLNDKIQVRDTILHETAHAPRWPQGPGTWARVARDCTEDRMQRKALLWRRGAQVRNRRSHPPAERGIRCSRTSSRGAAST